MRKRVEPPRLARSAWVAFSPSKAPRQAFPKGILADSLFWLFSRSRLGWGGKSHLTSSDLRLPPMAGVLSARSSPPLTTSIHFASHWSCGLRFWFAWLLHAANGVWFAFAQARVQMGIQSPALRDYLLFQRLSMARRFLFEPVSHPQTRYDVSQHVVHAPSVLGLRLFPSHPVPSSPARKVTQNLVGLSHKADSLSGCLRSNPACRQSPRVHSRLSRLQG